MNSFTSAFGSGGGGGGGAGLGANTFTGAQTVSVNGAASTPALSLTGSIFTGGTGTTTKPLHLIEPAGTTSTGWSTSGTVLGLNAPTGFAGHILAAHVNGSEVARIDSAGRGRFSGGAFNVPWISTRNGSVGLGSENTTLLQMIVNTFEYAALGLTSFQVGSGHSFSWSSGATVGNISSTRAQLTSPASETVQMGATSATPATQTFKGPNGSGTNIAAGKICLAPGQSTGNATPAVLALQGTAAGTSGTTAQTLVDVLSIIRQGVVRISNIPTSSTGLSTGDIWSDAGTLKIV
ncbi:hypothetical protein UFOVP817_24 [uncultured Caudovirales phage]|uniref:Uncharacterized protein n=1 Tax=uncultured Caudovirales phage TaxID=2100421 RepID=A0A6J5P133_9CAUD|nr:hypothetical protein UFOVP817_24 [uncultured Caudovirales phage]